MQVKVQNLLQLRTLKRRLPNTFLQKSYNYLLIRVVKIHFLASSFFLLISPYLPPFHLKLLQ